MSSKKEYSLDNIFNAGQSWPDLSATSLLMPRILQQLFTDIGDRKLQYGYVSGTLTKDHAELVERIMKAGGKPVIHKFEFDFVFVWEGSYLNLDYNKKSKMLVCSGYYLDPEVGDLFKEIEKDFITKEKKNLIFSIVKSSFGLEAKSLGDGSSPLITENYHPDVLTDIQFVIDSWKKNPPPGRICILDGEPGTGKTHLIRSMLSQLDCVFLIVPSNMIDNLDKPDFMPLLLRVRDDHDKPIILVIEDGDTCLVPRKNDNISMIASLLNLSDGILGAIMDIRMIISTNANIREVDEAIKRPGRLCKQIHVGPLDYDQANKVYQRLMNDDKLNLDYRKFYTLAEIYAKVNNKDAPVPAIMAPKKVIGFSANRSYDDNVVMNKKE